MKKYKINQTNTASKRRSSRLVGWSICLVILIAVSWLAYNYHSNNSRPVDPNSVETMKSKDTLPPASKDEDKTSDQIPPTPKASLQIIKASQENNTIKIDAVIQNAVQGGTCVATFTKEDSKPVVHEYAATKGKDTSEALCNSDNIPALEFTTLGEWKMQLRYYIDQTQVDAQTMIIIK